MLRRIGRGAETAFCFLALSVFLGAYTTIPLRLQGIEYKGGDSNPFNAAAMAFLLLGTVILASAHGRRFLFVAGRGGVLNFLLILALASALWSAYPAISARRAIGLLQTVGFAYYLAARFPVERVIRLLAGALAVVLVASAALALAVPKIGVMHDPDLAGAWCGAFSHKSSLGAAAILGVLCFGWLWACEPRRRALHALGVLLSLFLAVMARSTTAQVTIVLIAAIVACLPVFRLPGLVRLWAVYAMVVAAVGASAIVLFFFVDIMEALGKDPSLTGRTPIWSSLLDLMTRQPIGGYGYSGFFIAGNPDVEQVWRRAGWDMWDAHSTFIGMLLELGIPGFMLSVWALAEATWRSLRAWVEGALPWAGFALVYVLILATMSVVESVMFRSGDMHSVMFPLLFVALRLRAAATRSARAPADASRAAHRPGPIYGIWR